jgi:hypothetical protein
LSARSIREFWIRRSYMAAKQLAQLTLKDVFENSFGKAEGASILAEIQEAYGKGLTGPALKTKADEIVAKHKPPTGDTRSFVDAAATAATTAGTTAAVG